MFKNDGLARDCDWIEGTSIPLVGPLVAKVKKVGLLKQPTANYRVNDPLEAH